MAHYTYEYDPDFSTSDPNPWIVPTGTYNITIACWGGGGCGGRSTSVVTAGGGGGGCGVNIYSTLASGSQIDITVGYGGRSVGTNNGGDSSISINTLAPDCEGIGGVGISNNGSTGGNGGSATGDNIYIGGNGVNGSIYSGGGGGGAGNQTNGGNASGTSGGSGGTYNGGNGGNGRSSEGSGYNGSTYGGGGGGSIYSLLTTFDGGDGGSGHVTIDFYVSDTANEVMNIVGMF